jgi:hypothetical protein
MLTLLTNNIPKNLFAKIGTLIAFVSLSAGGGEFNKTLSADFTKTKSGGSGVERVAGNLFWLGDRMVVTITSPIRQFFLIDSESTLIYNSGERSAVKLHSKNPAVLPLFTTFIGFFKGEQMVPRAKFRIKSSVKRGDSLYTQWVPEGDDVFFKGNFVTVYCVDEPVRAATYDNKGNLLYRMTFGHDTLIDGTRVPLRISTLTPVCSDSTLEEVDFRNVSVNKPVPAGIVNFKIPPEVPIKVLEW